MAPRARVFSRSACGHRVRVGPAHVFAMLLAKRPDPHRTVPPERPGVYIPNARIGSVLLGQMVKVQSGPCVCHGNSATG